MPLQINHVAVAGNLTRDPELRSLPNGGQVTNFCLALNRRWRDAEGTQREETCFLDCEAWGRQAENVAQYLRKGAPAHVEGRLKQDVWEDNDGRTQRRIKVVAFHVQFLGGPERGSQNEGPREHEPQRKRPVERPAAGVTPVVGADAGALEAEPPF